ncbi:hypothetical protein BS78_10G260200 [Paspalum vaginatum]|nr:hypothetical protein BS78_10G260200 [Paspalum vaginatum]
MVARSEEGSSLERMLLEGDKRWISIVGESGIGKSTLARMVFDSNVVKNHFNKHAYWLDLRPRTTEIDALYMILQLVCPPPAGGETNGDKDIRGALTESLKNKRYVIVLDSTENKLFDWSSVLGALPANNPGSRVVIIDDGLNGGDSELTAFAGASMHTLRLGHLKQRESRLMFRRHAVGSGNKEHLSKSFGRQDLPQSEYRNQIMEDMFEVTAGFPLAILLLGRLLRRKEYPGQWIAVLGHLKSMERSSRLDRIMAMSFDDLPHPLKLCFLYFSMMPQNINYAAAVLVRRWAAEGFLKPAKRESMEDVGNNYLKELISRGMVHIKKKGPLTCQGFTIRRVFIHQRLHAMARSETQKGSFLDIYDNADVASPAYVRHLFIQNFRDVGGGMHDPFPKLRSLRCDDSEYRELVGSHFSEYWEPETRHYYFPNTTISSGGGALIRLLLKSKLLRVVELRGLQCKQLPGAIGDLVHLRYLCIRSKTLVELPSSIAKLKNLQTLDIQETMVKDIARGFWGIPALRHVLAEGLPLPPKPKSSSARAVLKSMQTLRGVVCGARHSTLALHSMINLRRLELEMPVLEARHWDGLSVALRLLESLVRLHLKGETIPFALFTKYSMRQLQVLELHGRITMANDEGSGDSCATLPNLSWLLLKHSKVNQDFIDKLGKHPRLVELVLSDEAIDGDSLAFSHQFCNLTELALRNRTEFSVRKITGLESLPKVKKITASVTTPNSSSRIILEPEEERVLRTLGEFEPEDMLGSRWSWRRKEDKVRHVTNVAQRWRAALHSIVTSNTRRRSLHHHA